MNNIIKILIFFFFFYFSLKLFTRYLLPLLIERFIRKTEKKYRKNTHKNDNKNNPPHKEGEINIKYIPDDYEPIIDDDELGEYVDYEDLEEDNDK